MDNVYSQMILNLVIVLSFMLALVYVSKKIKSKKLSANKHIKIINMVPLGTKEKIILLEVNNLTLLVGATPNHIETLHVFQETSPLKSTEETAPNKKVTFADHMAATELHN